MKKLNWFQIQLLKLATRFIKKYNAFEINVNTRLLLHNQVYCIVEYEARSAIDEVDSLTIKAQSPNYLIKH